MLPQPMLTTDWARVIANLRTCGMSLRDISEATGITKGALHCYTDDRFIEPSHYRGERLIALWCERTKLTRADLPTRRVVLSVSAVLRG